jgi:acyl-CoA synthetase (NDP forming)
VQRTKLPKERFMNIDKLLRPRSVAIVGASESSLIARQLIGALDKFGFKGRIYPINPKYETVLGRKCYPSLRVLPGAPDVVSLCVGHKRVMESFRLLPEVGAGAAVIYDGGFGEEGEEGRALEAELQSICREAGIALGGPNCMGIVNPPDRSTTYPMEPNSRDALTGNVGLISQSGSICIGLMSDVRRFGFSLVVSAGNEAVVGAAQYLNWLVDDPNTKIIALFLEAVREPEPFIAALDRAASAGKPVVVLKVGKSERTRRAIISHTGGLAGESKVFSEVLKAHRAIEVDELDEFTEVLAVCQGKRWPKGRRMSIVTSSGGLASLVLDVASKARLELPPLPPETRAAAESVIGPIGEGNPLDAWGHGDYRRNLPHALTVLNESPTTDAIGVCVESFDLNPMESMDMDSIRPDVGALAIAAGASQKPHFLLNMRPSLMHRADVSALAKAGVVVLTGTRQGLSAVDRMARWAEPVSPPARNAKGRSFAASIAGRSTVHEYDAKAMLATYGLSVTRENLATTLDVATAAAMSLGYPVVLKAVSDEIPHRSDYGLVKVGIADEAALAAAWSELGANLKKMDKPIKLAGMLVQEMIREGIEMFAGVSRDPQFGLILAVGFGGVEIEVMRDFALRPLPLREGDAETMLGELKGAARLGSFRGRPAVDLERLEATIYGLGDFLAAHRDLIAEIDLNPIKVLPEGRGAVVIDAVIVPEK